MTYRINVFLLLVVLGFCISFCACADRKKQDRDAEASLVQALEEFSAGNIDTARELLMPFSGYSASSIKVWRFLSKIAKQQENYSEALSWLDLAQTERLELALVHLDRAHLVWELGGGQDAVEEVNISLLLLANIVHIKPEYAEKLSPIIEIAMNVRNNYLEGLSE